MSFSSASARVKRRILRGVLVLVAAVAAAIVVVGARASHMLTGYKAKMLCSEVTVGGRAVDAVRSDLEVDDLRALRLFPVSFDAASYTATASLPFGLRPRRARFHDGAGCTLEFDDQPLTTPAPGASPLLSAPAAVANDAALRQVVDEAFREPDPARPRRTRAVVILRDGQIVAEHYAGGVDARTRFPGWSMTKSALNALVGILVGRGTLSLDAPADVPAWRTAGDPRRAITLDHLLRMSSGLDLDETIAIRRADVMAMLFEAPDMAAFAASAPLRAAPGSRWQYASGSSLIISSIIRRALGDDEYRRFPRSALFDRLGMDGAVIEADASGTFVASSYMYATAREWGRLGTLYLQDGAWERARVLPEGWVDYTRTPAPADRDRVYGAHFWLTLPETYNPHRTNLPPGTFHAAGHEGQFVSIVPARGVVVVRLGKTRHAAAWDQAQFVADVLAAMR